MCGIVGYIGSKSVDSVLIVGLKKLEYRGYDSAGIALIDHNELVVRKAKGKISDLEEEIKTDHFVGTVGIGHTRWATHGEPNAINAHPHTNKNKSIAVVHNGIIENYLELKKELLGYGYLFQSETDTEVLPFLIDYFFQKEKDIEKAFIKTIAKIEGKFAVAVISEFEPQKIFFVRNGAPLILAMNRSSNEYLLASDIPAIIPIANESYYLEEGECGYISHQGIRVYNSRGVKVEPVFEKIVMKSEDIEKGEYAHFMLKEIYEQPGIIRNIIKNRIQKGEIVFSDLNITNAELKNIGRILIQACGTSHLAGMVGKYYFEQYSKILTETDYSSEFRYRNPIIGGDTLVIGISQSGETADTIAGIHEAKSKFIKVLTFLNNKNSTMARESDGIIELLAGPEVGVASTKAYTAQLVNLLLFSLYLGLSRKYITNEEVSRVLKEVEKVPEMIEHVLNNQKSVMDVAGYLKDQTNTIFLGRTYNYPTALEGALKLKEISYIHASGYAAGEFKHGPIALVTENMPVIVVAPKSEIRAKVISNLLEVKARKGKIISIITAEDDAIKDLSDYYIEIPEIDEALSPLLTIIPLQLIAYHTAVLKGCNVDRPRNLAKSVTVE